MASGFPGMSCGRMMLLRTLPRILSDQLASAFCRAAACCRAISSRIWRSWRSRSWVANCCCSRAICSRIVLSKVGSAFGLGLGFASIFGSGLGFGLGFSGSAISGFFSSGSGSGLTTTGGGGVGCSTPGPGGPGGGGSHSSTSTVTGGELWKRTPRNSTAISTTCVNADKATDGPSAGSRRPAESVAAVIFPSLGELHLQADAAHALLLQLVHHLEHCFVARVLVAADEHRDVGILAARLLDRVGELAARYRALADDGAGAVARANDEAAVGLDEHLERHDLGLARLRHRRQVDDRRRDQRRGHHEDHQEHEHHVDVRHDVDLVHGAAPTGRRHFYFTAWRWRMFENSSMKLSKRLPRRSTSCE